MSTAKAYRLPDGDWVCELNAMAVYKGSANKADDMAKQLNGDLARGGEFAAERFALKAGDKKAWHVLCRPTYDGQTPIKSFGNSGNKADDFASELNAAVRRGQPLAQSEMPAVPVPDMLLKPVRHGVSYGDTTVIGGTPAEREYHELTRKDRDNGNSVPPQFDEEQP